MKHKFFIYTYYGEILDLAIHLKNLGNEVVVYIQSDEYKKIGDGIVDKADNWYEYLGKDYIWVFDGCENGKLQDWLRSKGEYVFGGSEKGDKLENDRQLGQALFKKAGYPQPFSQNFKDIGEAQSFVNENKDKRWILKQNGNAPKHLNHMGKFDDNIDMLYHLNELEKSWNTAEYGEFDCDLMEVVDGMEVAASAFFNGTDWMKNKDGKVVGFLNFEEKKETNGNMGETTGEMGTTFYGVTEDNKLFKEIILNETIKKALKNIGFRGVFDINGSLTKNGYVAFEPTCRFGVPATAYEFIEGMENTDDMIVSVAMGENKPINIKQGIGMVMVVASKPFPLEGDIPENMTSLGEKLWILHNKKPVKEFSSDQKKHIHLYNFHNDGDYKVATKSGYLLTVTGTGKDIKTTRNNLIEYIKNNLYISGMKIRTDIGSRVEEYFKK